MSTLTRERGPWLALAAAAALLGSLDAPAQSVSPAAYKARLEAIGVKSNAAQAACNGSTGNARDICLAQAKGDEAVAVAELKALYTPVDKTRYELEIARAQATYRVAREKCDDLSGTAKDRCTASARAAQSAAEKKALEPVVKAGDKRGTAFETTRARCETYAPEARERCLNAARQR